MPWPRQRSWRPSAASPTRGRAVSGSVSTSRMPRRRGAPRWPRPRRPATGRAGRPLRAREADPAPAAPGASASSWLYNLDAYRRLFPLSYLATAHVAAGRFQHMPLWGQFVDRHGAIKEEPARQFLERLERQSSPDALEQCFPASAARGGRPGQDLLRVLRTLARGPPSGQRRPARVPVGGLLVRVAQAKDRRLVERAADELEGQRAGRRARSRRARSSAGSPSPLKGRVSREKRPMRTTTRPGARLRRGQRRRRLRNDRRDQHVHLGEHLARERAREPGAQAQRLEVVVGGHAQPQLRGAPARGLELLRPLPERCARGSPRPRRGAIMLATSFMAPADRAAAARRPARRARERGDRRPHAPPPPPRRRPRRSSSRARRPAARRRRASSAAAIVGHRRGGSRSRRADRARRSTCSISAQSAHRARHRAQVIVGP